jgi:hypothetical protein
MLMVKRPSSPTWQPFANEINQLGIKVAAPACDVIDAEALQSAFAHCADEGMPPIKVHACCVVTLPVVADAAAEKREQHEEAVAKHHGGLDTDMDLDPDEEAVAKLHGGLDTGNTSRNALARRRQARGPAASSIDVGMMLQ